MPEEITFCNAKEIILGGDKEEEEDDFDGSVKRPKGVSDGTWQGEKLNVIKYKECWNSWPCD